MPRNRAERVAAQVGLFVALYLALFAASFWSGALLAAERAMAGGAVAIMSGLGDPQLRRHVEVSRLGGYVAYDFSVSAPGGTQKVRGKHAFHAQNLVLFAALLLATPGLGARRRSLALAVGLAAIFAIDTLIVVGDLVNVEDQRFTVAGEHNVPAGLKALANALRYSQPTGGAFMAPVFVWGILMALNRLRAPRGAR